MPDILAAGVVVFRPGREVLLVHRPAYDDWSFPKGKLDRGEHAVAAAVREVAEETGLHVRLGPPLGSQRYPVGQRSKTVHYWTGRVVGSDDVSGYRPNDEIDEVRWVGVERAEQLLTYEHDRATLAEALTRRRRTRALVILRHARARSRTTWRTDDRLRPLLQVGEAQASALVPLLAAYDVREVVSSPSTRCVQTVRPFVETTGYALDLRAELSEERADAAAIDELVARLEARVAADAGVVVCSHRPVLPLVVAAAGLEDTGPELEPAELLVVHLRKGRVVAVERHAPGRAIDVVDAP